MSKGISNKGNVARKGKVFARQQVRLGWRKLARLAFIEEMRKLVLLNQAGVKLGEGSE